MSKFSIIIPTYNRESMLPKALQSIKDQTFLDWECIIVDDGSTDNTRALIEKWSGEDHRFRYIYQENAERSAARNFGIENSNGEYICFLDSDDYYLPERLNKLYEWLAKQKENCSFVFTDITFKTGDKFKNITYKFPGKDQSIFDFFARNVVGIPQVCISRDVFENIKFNPNFRIGEDFELWLRIADSFPILYQDDNNSVIACEHEDRSVNLKSYNSPKEQLISLKFALDKNHPGSKISTELKQKLVGNCYFNSAKHFMFNNKKCKAVKMILKSIFADLSGSQTKHKIYCLLKLSFGVIPLEYRK